MSPGHRCPLPDWPVELASLGGRVGPHETGRPALRVAREVKRGKEREESAPGHPFWVTHSSSSIVPVRAVALSATAIDYTHTSKSGMLRAGGVGSAPSLPGPYYTRCYCARCSLTVRSLQLAGCSSYRDSLIKSSRFEHRVKCIRWPYAG